MAGGVNVMPGIHEVLQRMARFAREVRTGSLTGAGGERFTDVVNIGIGGSDLGPAMTTLALAPYHDGPRLHYVSNVDGAHLADTLRGLDPARTLFLIASKTFTTIETMTNAETARRWVEAALGGGAVGKHFCAVSTALDLVARFGIDKDRVFGFWDWVGGRYSLWSAIGLPIMIAVGPENFQAFLEGAHAMDRHFATAPALRNMPIIMGLIGFWHRVVCACPARAVIPYDQRLARLPAYLQQLDMESNGKSVTADGQPLGRQSAAITWGGVGTDAQHAVFQLLHQGTRLVPVEFIACIEPGHDLDDAHHRQLLNNCFAQGAALMAGRANADGARAYAGDRPSSTILLDQLDPRTLGALIAFYEHRVFANAVLLGINPFDQFGVELGKEMAKAMDSDAAAFDASTNALMARAFG
jgi:glucose-6-phosphate isomerase